MLSHVMSSTVTSAAVAAAPQGLASRGGQPKFGLFGKRNTHGRGSIRSGRSTVKSTTVMSRALPDDAEVSHQSSSSSSASLGRRGLLSQGSAAALIASLYAQQGGVAHAGEITDNKMVGAYLPEAEGEPGFNVFTAGPTRTPALRAGALEPYQVLLPSTWKEAPVSNAKSGNYCQPRCDEATTEVQFVDPTAGSIQIIIIPTTKLLISKPDPSIDDVSTIAGLLEAIGPAITGSVAVEPEEVVSMEEKVIDGKKYYTYELLTPFAESGVHNLAAMSTSKNYVMMATMGASEKQWGKHEEELKKIIASFRVNVK